MLKFIARWKTNVFGAEGELWEVSPNAWHYRLYRYWQNTGGRNRYRYQENFCHYFRVVFLWAPLRWVIMANYKSYVRPWWFLSLVVLGVIGIFWPKVALVIIIYPITLLVTLVIAVGVFGMSTSILHKTGAYRWMSKNYKVALMVFLLTAVIIIGMIGYFDTYYFLRGLAVIGITSGVLVVFILAVVGTLILWGNASKPEKGTGPLEVIRLAGRFLINNKKKICPFVKLPDESVA